MSLKLDTIAAACYNIIDAHLADYVYTLDLFILLPPSIEVLLLEIDVTLPACIIIMIM